MTIYEKLISEYLEEKETYEEFLTKMIGLVKEIIGVSKLDAYQISGRVKGRNSITKKILTQKNETILSPKEIPDLIGIRIITHYSSEIPKIVKVIAQNFSILDNYDPQFILGVDPAYLGYPVHRIILELSPNRRQLIEYERYVGFKIELQICTLMQHAWEHTERGLGYLNKPFPKEKLREFRHLAYLLELYDEELSAIRDFLKPMEWQAESAIDGDNQSADSLENQATPIKIADTEEIDSGKLESLDESVLEKITLSHDDLPIDAKIFENFILTSELVRYLDRSISVLYDIRLAYDKNSADILIQAVQTLPAIRTTSDLEKLLLKECRTVFKMSQSLLGSKIRDNEYLIKGVSVFLLLYLLVAKQGDLGHLRHYLEKFTFDEKLINKSIIRMLLEYVER